jgi:hypothetical protein
MDWDFGKETALPWQVPELEHAIIANRSESLAVGV